MKNPGKPVTEKPIKPVTENPGKSAIKKPGKPTVIKILIGLAVFLVAAVLHIAFNVTGLLGAGGELRWMNTGRGVSYTTDAGAVFHAAGGTHFTVATRDGVRNISQLGETRFHYSMNLRTPIMSARGEFVAVSEGDRGRSVHVFDSTGRVFTESFNHAIHTFSVNRTGFLTVILQLDEGYDIRVYHGNQRERSLYSRLILSGDHPGIIPVMAEVSDDGRYIVYGLLDVNNRLVSRLQFSYTYLGDGWGTDGIFFGRDFGEDELLLALRKTANNRVVAITDKQILILTRGTNNVITTTAEIPLHNYITGLAFDESGGFAVALGPSFLNAPEVYAAGTVYIFDANGTRTGMFHAGRAVTHLSMGHDTVIVGANRNFNAVSLTGEPLWEFIALHDVREFFFLENSDTVLIAGAMRADIWRRQRIRDGEEGDFFGITGQD